MSFGNRFQYNRGRRLASSKRHVWIFGGIERVEREASEDGQKPRKVKINKAFMVRVANRRKEVLDAVIRKYIAPGTTLMTDGAAVYIKMAERLADMNLKHKSVNHKKGEFVGFQDKTAYTNTIESAWRHLKWKVVSFRHNGAIDQNIADYLYRRVHFAKNPMDDGPNFRRFLTDIAAVYPGPARQGLRLVEVIPPDLQDCDEEGGDDSSDDLSGDDDMENQQQDEIEVQEVPDADKVMQQKLPTTLPDRKVVCTVGGISLTAGALRAFEGMHLK